MDIEIPKLATGGDAEAAVGRRWSRMRPVPVRKIIGDLSDIERVLVGLDLRAGP